MIKKQLLLFVLRWAGSTLGMWICITLFGTITAEYTGWMFVLAGLIFSLVNTIVKPLATMISLPLIIFTMGIFTFILNVAMVALTVLLLPDVTMSFGGAALSAIVLSLINYLVNLVVPAYNKEV